MQRQRQRSGNRSCGHCQYMRIIAFLLQSCTLLHPKSMLFINHNQTQFIELYRVFNQRMGANEKRQFSREQFGMDFAALGDFGRTREQLHGKM